MQLQPNDTQNINVKNRNHNNNKNTVKHGHRKHRDLLITFNLFILSIILRNKEQMNMFLMKIEKILLEKEGIGLRVYTSGGQLLMNEFDSERL